MNEVNTISGEIIQSSIRVHKAQTLTYLKVSPYEWALLINFGEPLLKSGVHRFVDGGIPQ